MKKSQRRNPKKTGLTGRLACGPQPRPLCTVGGPSSWTLVLVVVGGGTECRCPGGLRYIDMVIEPGNEPPKRWIIIDHLRLRRCTTGLQYIYIYYIYYIIYIYCLILYHFADSIEPETEMGRGCGPGSPIMSKSLKLGARNPLHFLHTVYIRIRWLWPCGRGSFFKATSNTAVGQNSPKETCHRCCLSFVPYPFWGGQVSHSHR